MTWQGWTQAGIFMLAIVALVRPAGDWIARAMKGDRLPLRAVERLFHRTAGVDATREQGWLSYATSLLLFSFVTNTSWQAYAGEQTMSHLSQMLGITVQSFLSGATGIVVAIALVRGFARAGGGRERGAGGAGRPGQ
jgi:K+-transporting ATPase ATPase A chain